MDMWTYSIHYILHSSMHDFLQHDPIFSPVFPLLHTAVFALFHFCSLSVVCCWPAGSPSLLLIGL